ncbi:hypothetical protein ACQX8C_14550 [Staphylococcus aureus]|jgi:hypothetical protein|uniref:Uncharacterized protein n=4 Tax=root TaxID=1 RepID=A0A8S5UHV8_9CAUD|nr:MULTISPECIES: hypothetical protein [Enterococcus]ELG7156214.1 hypothetical protein [Staphylococcus aureus]DAF94017.1 MAG TPA: hypothetical protein [Myoviridae sp. ctu2j3]ELL1201295.1 hypothetical protein [Staphylococcus aureus]MDN3079875.1 hypothetical protein [Enterococcus faecium]MDN3104139.1 hypothetical protein [Enterococcus faecalis]
MNERQLERAARELCKLRGQDPDMIVCRSPEPDKDGWVQDIGILSPQWKLVVDEIKRYHEISIAIGRVQYPEQFKD